MALEDGSADAEALHAVFRAIHSIKGGAGAFGFDRLVSFAHAFETMLDLMREGKVELTPELVSLSVRGGDVLADLVNAARGGEDLAPGHEDQLLSELNVAAGLDDAGATADAAPDDGAAGDGDLDDFDFTPVPVNLDDDEDDADEDEGDAGDVYAGDQAAGADDEVGDDEVGDEDGGDQPSLRTYRIEFKPRAEMLRRANEPLLIVRQLKELGSLQATADISGLPCFDELEPDGAYLAWTFELETDVDPELIDEAFEFVVDDCHLTIAPLDPAAEEAAQDTAEAEAAPAEAPAAAPKAQDQAKPAPDGPAKAAAPATTPPAAAEGAARKAPVDTGPAVTAIRVDLDRVDRLVNMVGEIVIAQAMVSQQIDEDLSEAHPGLTLGLEQLFQHTRSLQDSVMAIRAQPVRSVFARMPRLVRDLSAQTSKKMRLEMSGENTEIDKTVIEQLNDPLTHMIRNAADHGIESVEEREAAGKPAEGTIYLNAEQRGGRIVIEIADDGKGVNRERVREKAIEKGLIAADANLSDEEIDNLVFLPGFSTAETISNISGRGVGMDVVRQNIQKLGGRVSIKSQPGRGSTVILTLPLTLAVLDGMIVRVGGE
jgi:two-component system chemotaxis sensor kinase CheA